MGLKQHIVVKNEYTNNVRSAKGKGSRGASPGQYVLRYMAREDATEVLTPVRVHSQNPVFDGQLFSRYMARHDATERLKGKQDELLQDEDSYGSPLVLKHRFKRMDKLSGRAFGSKGVSLSHNELEASSTVIQDAFDDGHSVQKIILSFTEDYLRETGVLSSKFKHKGRGSYRGQIDQLKLRQAIIQGVDQMVKAGRYAKPEWVGTVQVDTSHVHAHIALVDTEFSQHRMKPDGSDKGKINEREKKMLRKGIHFSLEDMKDLKSFHKQSSLERQNVVMFVKDYAYSTIRENTSIQLLVASLPKDRRAWRYGTNRVSMKYPNELAVQIVERVFDVEPEESGYTQAMAAVVSYADESAEKNKLSQSERDVLVANGRERIVERSVNGLYRVLKEIDSKDLTVRTSMTDIQSSSDDELASALKQVKDVNDSYDLASFALRVRGYKNRQDSHAKDSRQFYDLVTEYDAALDAGFVDDTAHVMRVYYEEELRYHMGLTDKYRKFLMFNQPYDKNMVLKMMPVYERLAERFRLISDEEATRGMELADARQQYELDLKEYTFACFEAGVATLKEWDAIRDDDGGLRFVLPVRPKTRVENLTDLHFNRVKAWDVHDLGLDYYNKPDARIDSKNAVVFAEAWESRRVKATAAKVYVDATNQRLDALERTLTDVSYMRSVVDKAIDEGLIQTVTLDDLEAMSERQRYTIAVDKSVDVSRHIRDSLLHIQEVEPTDAADVWD